MIENKTYQENTFIKLPLRFALIIPFALQILIIVGVIGWFSFRNGQHAINELSTQLRSEITIRIQERLRSFFELPEIVNKIQANAINSGMVNFGNISFSERYLFKQLKAFDFVSTTLLADEKEDNYLGIRRINADEIIIFTAKEPVTDLHLYSTDSQGNRGDHLKKINIPHYKTRPWYKAVKKSKSSIWTGVYQCIISGEPTIATAMPVIDSFGEIKAVVAAAFRFDHIHDYLKTLTISPNGLAFLLQRSGNLMTSSSSDEKGYLITKNKMLRVKANNSKNEIIKQASIYLEESFGGLKGIRGTHHKEFDVAGKKYYLQISEPGIENDNLDFLIVVVVPEDDFMDEIHKNTQMTVILCIAALITAIVIGILTARWVTNPILRLNRAAKEIAKGKWDKNIRINRNDELAELAISFNNMSNQLKDSFKTLEQRVKERTKELTDSNKQLNIATKKAELANKTKSDFLAGMSHELRTPMNAILGFSQLIHHDKTLKPEHRDHLSIIRRSGRHLLALINDVLDMSKVEAGKTTLNENNFNLHNMLDDLKNMLGLRAGKKGLALIVEYDDIPRYVRTDETKLRQVLINIIANAVKFTEKGRVQLSVCSKQLTINKEKALTDNCLVFTVKDTGPGIPKDEIDILFEPFVQSKTGKLNIEGTGLGLSISREFVQLMGGNIVVHSQVGKGTTFKFDIRAHPVDSRHIENKSNSCRQVALKPGQSRYKILIVDDNKDNRKLLFKILEPFGFKLYTASNGQEAVELWHKYQPDLIWMDIRMPVMDGYEAVKTIRGIEKNNPNLPKTIIIAQTASTFEDERAGILEAGCDDFLRKPYNERDIYDLMHRHMGICFIYEDAETKKSAQNKPKSINPREFSSIPDDILKRLEKFCVDADMENIETIINEITKINPDLANKLAALAENFEYGKIADLINKYNSRRKI